MASYVIRPESREKWLEFRKLGIGSSEAATILGLNPFDTPLQLWRRKRGIDAPIEENFAMRAGHYLEDAVAQFWHDATGCDIIKRSAIDWLYVKEGKDFLRASPDRTFWIPGMTHNDHNKGILECKTTQRTIDADDLPKHWFVQVQYQLGVSELQQASIAWLTQGREFGYKDLAFVPDFYEWIESEVERFWKDNVVGGQEPEVSTVGDVLLKYPRHKDQKVVTLEEVFKGKFDTQEELDSAIAGVIEACDGLKELKNAEKELKQKKEEYEETIKLCFGDAEAISYAGNTLATWKAAKDGQKFDEKKFIAENAELAEKYMTVRPGARTLRLK